MQLGRSRRVGVCVILTLFAVPAVWPQESVRDIRIDAGSTVEIINRSGRVAILAVKARDKAPIPWEMTASGDGGVSENEVIITATKSRVIVTVSPSAQERRIDLTLRVPERTRLKVETTSGAIEFSGNFESIEAKTETGTIVTDTPTEKISYQLFWTESRPRYLSDFVLTEVKERSGGRFEIKGRLSDERAFEKNSEGDRRPMDPDYVSKDVSLKLSTARGIILLNVPPKEVLNDLRQRPLTEAARAIIRSGDSLLTEAIRRASPKYFGDYLRTLPPIITQPNFASRSATASVPVAAVKTAYVRVTDLKNRAIPGLERKDFEVVEDGKNREILSVGPSTTPFNLVLLLDVSGSIENYVNFIRKAARNFVETVGAEDRVSIIAFNEDVKVLSSFTKDKGVLSRSLDTFDAGGGTAYYDALAYTLSETLRPLKGNRTAIVVLTDGDDNRSFLSFDSLAGSIQESGSLIYPLYVPSGLIALASQNPNADIDPTRKRYMSLTAKSEGEGEKLAKLSGGVYYPITEVRQIREAYEDIVLQMRTAYTVTFRSDASASPENSPRLRIKAKTANSYTTVTSVVASGD